MIRVRLEKHLEHSLCRYPELIDDNLWGIKQGAGVIGPDWPTLNRQDKMPNARIADMVFVEKARVTVVEIKKYSLVVRDETGQQEDVVDQLVDYLQQCRIKYPGRAQYRGIVVGSRVPDQEKLARRIDATGETITALVFGRDIPAVIKFCVCGRAVDYFATRCRCGARHQ
jgi:hypothetical protein